MILHSDAIACAVIQLGLLGWVTLLTALADGMMNVLAYCPITLVTWKWTFKVVSTVSLNLSLSKKKITIVCGKKKSLTHWLLLLPRYPFKPQCLNVSIFQDKLASPFMQINEYKIMLRRNRLDCQKQKQKKCYNYNKNYLLV